MDLKAQTAGQNLPLGIALVTTAFFCAAIMSTLSKSATGTPALSILFLQYAISFAVFVPSAAKLGLEHLKTDHFRLHLLRSVAGSVCQLLFFLSVGSIPLLDSVLLSNTSPLFIPFLAYFWFGRPVSGVVLTSLCVGLLGIIMIIKPGPQMLENPASLIALASGMCSALALVSTNKLTETEPPVRILFYNFGISTVLLIPFALWTWRPLTGRQWLLLLGVGCCYAVTQYLIILAYRYANATELSPFNYAVVVFSGLLGWLVFGNVPDALAIAGTLLVCAGGILSVRAGHTDAHGHAFGYGHWQLAWKMRRKAAEAGAASPGILQPEME